MLPARRRGRCCTTAGGGPRSALSEESLADAVERLRCPVVLMRGREDRVATDKWPLYSGHPVETAESEGGHFFVEERRPEMAALTGSRIRLQWQRRAASAT